MLPHHGLARRHDQAADRSCVAFFGFGYEMKVVICERPHVLVCFGGPVTMPKHLRVDLTAWNEGGPDRTVISWKPDVSHWYTITDSPKGAIVLESSGKPVRLRWLLEPQDSNQPFEFKVGDTFVMTLILPNGTPQHFKAKVTQ